MRTFLLGCVLSLLSFSVSAQMIAADSASIFPDNRTRLVARSNYMLAQTKVSGTVVNKKLWLNGIRSINGVAANALTGDVAVATGLDQATADSRYPLLGTSYANPAFVSSLAANKLTGTLAATNMGALTGDVTSAAGSYGTTIGTNVVTNAKLAPSPANSFKGNNTGSAANAADLTVAQSRALLVVDQVNNTSDVNKPVSTAQAAAIAVKASTFRAVLTNAVNGQVIPHGLNSSNVIVHFKPTGSNTYDYSYSFGPNDVNSVLLVTPFDANNTRETFTGEVFFITAN